MEQVRDDRRYGMVIIPVGVKRNTKIIIAFVFLLSLMSSGVCAADNTSLEVSAIGGDFGKERPIPDTAALVAIVSIVFIFALLITLGCWKEETLDKGQMRRAISGTFVIGFIVMAALAFIYNIEREGVVTAYIAIVSIITGFYFGAKTAFETLIGENEPIRSTHRRPPDGNMLTRQIQERNTSKDEISSYLNTDDIWENLKEE
jgi:hypothetical protein